MTITLTAKLKLKNLNNNTYNLLVETLNTYTLALNYASQYAANNNCLSFKKLHKAIYKELRSTFKLPSQMACSVCKTVTAKYKSLKTNKQLYKLDKKGKPTKELNIPVFKNAMVDLVFNRDYSFNKLKNQLSIKTITNRIKVDFYNKGFEQYFNNDWHFGTAILKQYKSAIYLYISVTKEVAEPICTNTVGVDVGLNFIATSYDGTKTTFYSGKRAKDYRTHYKKLRQELQSKNTKSSKRRLKAINERENRYINDVNHCITKALVQANPNSLFILENLSNIRPALASVKKKDRYYMVSWPYADFVGKLTYKALKNGSLVKEVDPKYTSQTCPICGHVAKSNRNRKEHLFACKACGYSSNDDRIGAMNLYNKRYKTA